MKQLSYKALYLVAFCFILSQHSFAQQQKYALVIGAKSYQYVAPLRNSLNDAQDMAATLKKKGFTVVEVYEPATKRIMQDGIIRYFKLLEGKPEASGLVFYSGHGMQVKGVNYLIPIQANPQIEADLDDQCVNMDYVMRAIQQAGNGLNIFIIDACRNNPFRGFSRSGEKGLSMVDTPQGSYIVYATKPGSVASDGTGRNGLFTSKLLQYINIEGLNIEQVFKQVAKDVATTSGNEQRPWIASDYTGDFYFTPGVNKATNTQPSTQPIVKTEPVYVAPTTIAFDYGYGSSDAPTVTVGSQLWLGKNLNVDRFANGDPIPEAQTEEEWKRADTQKQSAWCYYNNDPANGRTYGKLYNWYAVNDTRGLAPTGWHVPSDSEWDILIKRFLANGEELNKLVTSGNFTYQVNEGAGASLKNSSGWNENGNGTNASGIAGLPGGRRATNGTFDAIGKFGYWWSSSEGTPSRAWNRSLSGNGGKAFRDGGTKVSGFSVRCVRD
ncbi:hypothetical protein BH09BAC3_BH09BAC3_26000 [soil metagenome]